MFAFTVTKRLRDMTVQVDLALGAGVTALVGPSGAGKTSAYLVIEGSAPTRPAPPFLFLASVSSFLLQQRLSILPQGISGCDVSVQSKGTAIRGGGALMTASATGFS